MLLRKERPEREDDDGRGDGDDDHPPPRTRAGRFVARVDRRRRAALARLRAGYARALEETLEHEALVLLAAGLFVLASAALVKTVGLDFFPAVDAGLTRLHLRAPAGTRIEETERVVDAVEHEIRAIVPPGELETIDDNIGVPISYNLGFVPSDNIDGADAEVLVSFKPGHRPTAEYVRAIRQAVRERFPGVTAYFVQADLVSQVLDFGLPAPIDVQVESRDVKAALPIALALERAVAAVPGTEDVRLAQVLNHPGLLLDVDRARAAQIGLTERTVASSLLTSLSSSSLVSPNFWVNPKNDVNYFVVVQTPLFRIRTVNDLLATPITQAGGVVVPAPSDASSARFATPPPPKSPPPTLPVVAPHVGALAQLRPITTRANISHATVQPVLDVECNVEGRDLGAVANDIGDAVKRLGALPKGVTVHVRGQSETMFTSFGKLALGMLVAIALVYLLLVVLFQSWIDPLVIMIAVPGALSGVLWMLTVTGTTLNVESFMGAIMAIGIATSNSILLVNFANDVRIEREATTPRAAAHEAGHTRLRPVLMTALAMVLGMLPMALGLGEGGEQNAPLGRAVIGGLLVATPVTLFVVPSAYAAFRKRLPQKGHKDRDVAEADRAGEAAHRAHDAHVEVR
ncbi:MAG TPA: efflux RND transporter permease subunit, partial [Minicystis sp.]|nr:efflux RND transporter permease subunit [Minicystis sp.]